MRTVSFQGTQLTAGQIDPRQARRISSPHPAALAASKVAGAN